MRHAEGEYSAVDASQPRAGLATWPTVYALAYAAGRSCGIAPSDLVVSALDADTAAVNIAKGAGFVLATALLLWALLRRHEARRAGR